MPRKQLRSTESSESHSKWYTGRNRYLLESMLVFSLRRGLARVSWKVASLLRKGGVPLSSMVLWCYNAQSKYFQNISRKIGDMELSIVLEDISNAAEALSIAAGPESPYAKHLHSYKCHADKILMYLSLETFKENELAEVICKLNQKFPPNSTNPEVQSFRANFAKKLSSIDEINRFVSQEWLPQRSAAFKVLFNDARKVAKHFPLTCFDQVGTKHHNLFVQALSKMNTNLCRIVLSALKSETNGKATESKLLDIISNIESH